MIPKHRAPTHPGEILLKDFLEPMNVSQAKLADGLNVPIQRVNTIVRGKRGISAETAILLAQYFKTTPEFWMNLQATYDLYQARKELTPA